MDLGNTIYLLVIFVLIILFTISFALFIRRLLINTSQKNNHTHSIERQLEQIIEQNKEIISLAKEKK
ncbi:DUF4083 family protein [Viridibacillus arvi]|uniref:DUF4083 family protein n=1 Tax=Viridibacillus arvi TaxID=263475 RepID=UPI003CFE392B